MKKDGKKETPILIQMGIFMAILFVAQLLSQLFPPSFAVPTPLIGMIILYILLATHIIKLEQVEKTGGFIDWFDCFFVRTIWNSVSRKLRFN